MKEITQILNARELGDPKAVEDLLALVYDQLRQLARSKLAREAAGHTLQPTALVHEAWLRLVDSNQRIWDNQAHFFSAAAEAMRRILVDHARKKNSQKRGSGNVAEPLTESAAILSAPPEEVLAVHEALEKLAAHDPEAAELVKLRYFAGMKMDEASTALGLPSRTADRLWLYARTWLRHEIGRLLE
jgi:RNA polymerase sigma factor (TIGR02999 family)